MALREAEFEEIKSVPHVAILILIYTQTHERVHMYICICIEPFKGVFLHKALLTFTMMIILCFTYS